MHNHVRNHEQKKSELTKLFRTIELNKENLPSSTSHLELAPTEQTLYTRTARRPDNIGTKSA
jgi:hypothetical protein